MPGEETIANKLGEIPVLNDTWTTAWDCYTKLKDMNSLTKLTLETAESSMAKAAQISAPMVTHYQPQIETLNMFACSTLNELEEKYPVIKLPTDQVIDACLEYVQPMMGTMKPVVARVQGVFDDGKRRVYNIKCQGQKLVVGTRDLGVNTVTGAVSMTLATPPGRLATRTAEGALTIADGLVEKFIPEFSEEAEGELQESNSDPESFHCKNNVDAEVEQMQMMEASPERVVVHFKTVSKKLRQRLFKKAMRDFQGAKTRTQDGLRKLHGVVDLIDYAKNNFGSAKDKAEDIWHKIVTEEQVDSQNGDDNSAVTVEERIVTMGRILAQQIRSGIQTIERISQSAGEFTRNPISKSKEYKELILEFSTLENLQNLTKAGLEKVRENVRSVQNKLHQVISMVESPEWLSIQVDMEDIKLQEDDLLNPAEEWFVNNNREHFQVPLQIPVAQQAEDQVVLNHEEEGEEVEEQPYVKNPLI